MRQMRTALILTLATTSWVGLSLTGCGGSGNSGDHSTSTPSANTPQPSPVAQHPKPINFSRDIRPILSDKCFFCHGPDENVRDETGGIRLDSYAGATADYDGASPLVPGDITASTIIQRITSDNPARVMPPPASKHALTEEQVDLLTRWVAQGGAYDAGHWAFIPPTDPPRPAVSDPDWCRNDIDRFVLARLEEEGMSPSVEADRATLIRRVTLDLTGLPPTLEEIDAFLADPSSNAYEKMVDRLLASPRYGERMASVWLDQARYGDTNGFHHDHHRTMWPWRDWVVKSYNDNMPIDQFIVEQLAGDLLPNATREQILASGFNRNHNINDEGGALDAEYRVEAVADRIETTASVFLALTFNCCRCHDHKYDPFTQEDYYAFFAYFNSIEERGIYGADPNITAYPPSMQYGSTQTEASIAFAQSQLEVMRAQADNPSAEMAQAQSAWQEDLFASADIRWVDTVLTTAESSSGATLTAQADGSILATGTNPGNDTHTYTYQTDATGLRVLRLDALNDPALPQNKIGRADNGNAVLSGIEVVATSTVNPTQSKTIQIQWAWASFEQPNGDFDIFNAVHNDGDGWAVGAHLNNDPRTAIFVADEPFGFEGGTDVRITLKYESRYHQHTLGRVRLSLASAEALDLASLFPVVARDWFMAGPIREENFDAAYDTSHGYESAAFVSPHLDFGEGKPRFIHQLISADGVAHQLNGEQSAFYLARSIFTPIERTLNLSLGSDDGLRLYLNGQEVYANRTVRGVAPDQDQTPITLRAGENTLVLKIVNGGSMGGFYYQSTATQPSPFFLSPLALVAPDDRQPALRKRFNQQWYQFFSPAYRALIDQALEVQAEIDALNMLRASVLIMKELPEPTPTYVLARGDYSKPITEDFESGEPITPLTRRPPLPLGTLPDDVPNNRLGLARWLTHPNNPLTARVHINRTWQMIFGIGIVKTTEDFGSQADWPSHPELLDHLAVTFIAEGWNEKLLIKRIVMSATYRQASVVNIDAQQVDPENRLLAYFPRRRLSAEMIRDQTLFASGLMVERMGGPAVKPYQPEGLWREVSIPSSNTRDFQRSSGDDLYRRSLYTYWKRTAPNPQMAAFDAPTREFCVLDRGSTNTPLQALVLWNDEQYIEAARSLAARTLNAQDTDDERLIYLYRLCTGDTPGDARLSILREALAFFTQRYTDAPEDAAGLLAYGESPLPEIYDPAQLAAWSMIASTILALDETLVRD